uniref:hypothetical protein n=1 Tax=Brevundimonas sp. LF-1 TaxID=3126100 RepID=UPI00403DFF1F
MTSQIPPPALPETPTALPGFRLWPGLLDTAAQGELLAQVQAGLDAAPSIGRRRPAGGPFRCG